MNRKELSLLAIIIFASVIAWILFGVYHAKTSSSILEKDLRQVVPLTPTFDNDIISKISKRED